MISLSEYNVNRGGMTYLHFLGPVFTAISNSEENTSQELKEISMINIQRPKDEYYKKSFSDFHKLLIMLSHFRPQERINYFTMVLSVEDKEDDGLVVAFKK